MSLHIINYAGNSSGDLPQDVLSYDEMTCIFFDFSADLREKYETEQYVCGCFNDKGLVNRLSEELLSLFFDGLYDEREDPDSLKREIYDCMCELKSDYGPLDARNYPLYYDTILFYLCELLDDPDVDHVD